MDKTFKIAVNDSFNFSVTESAAQQFDAVKSNSGTHVLHNKKSRTVEVLKSDFLKKSYVIKVNGNRYSIHIDDELDVLINKLGLSRGEDVVANEVIAPMPGLIIEVIAKIGEEVKQGDFLCVLEAMKMENTLVSPRDGVIKHVTISKGQTVDKGDLLIEFEI